MSKYLVTGGAGFIGTNLVKLLLSEGHEVVVLDNYAGGRHEERFLSGVEYIEGDIRNDEDLDKACQGVSGIFHLAALPRVTYSVENPWLTHDVNVNGTVKVLLAAIRNKVGRVVFSSSSSTYGDQPVMPLKEDMVKLPISPYAMHKFACEHYCRIFSSIYNLETVSLNYVNVYGSYFDPEGPYALVVGKFIKQRKEGTPLTICGDGEYFRDFVHVLDVAKANLLAMQSSKVGKGEVMNIGNGRSFSVNQLARIIGGPTQFVPERPGDVRRTEADISRAKELLDWEPTIRFEDGVAELKREWGIE